MAEAPYAVPVPAPTPPKAPQQASELERLAAGFSKDGLDKTAIAHVLTLPAAKQTRLKTLLIVLNTILREIEGADLSVRKENLEARMQGLRGVLRAFIDENTPGRAAAKPAPLVNSTYIGPVSTRFRCLP